MEDLDNATLADVQAFFRTYYAPNNAILVVAGDYDPRRGARVDRTLLRRHPAAVASATCGCVGA
jgi:predicted Zn-dependent peptidase